VSRVWNSCAEGGVWLAHPLPSVPGRDRAPAAGAGGRSVCRRRGGVRYAVRAQLTAGDRLVAQAAAGGAPCLSRAAAAGFLEADPERLVAALEGQPDDAAAQRTGAGLREDQAAAALSVLTGGRRVPVINAGADAGKARILAEVARAWTAAGLGPVVGITASRSARSTLAAGVTGSCNSARFLVTCPAGAAPSALSLRDRGTLLVIDEASMMTSPDLADLIAPAEARGGKVIVAGTRCSRRRCRTAACPCSPATSVASASRSPSGSAPPGGRPPPCGCATAT
jgi:hypothetical protein